MMRILIITQVYAFNRDIYTNNQVIFFTKTMINASIKILCTVNKNNQPPYSLVTNLNIHLLLIKFNMSRYTKPNFNLIFPLLVKFNLSRYTKPNFNLIFPSTLSHLMFISKVKLCFLFYAIILERNYPALYYSTDNLSLPTLMAI